MTRQELARQRQQIATGQLDVGTLFVRTRQIYLDARANAAEFDEPRLRVDALYVKAHEAGVISDTELAQIQRKGALRDKVIRVDDFEYDFGLRAALDDVSAADQQQRRAAA